MFPSHFHKPKFELFYVLTAIYFLLCIVYAYERMLNTDSSFQLFNIINSKNFFFQENRFGVWLTQVPLLLSIYIHLPTKALLYIYSITFPLVYILIIWINIKYFKCKEAALATILTLIIGVAYTFFHSSTETHQILTISCLLYGAYYAKEQFYSMWNYYILILLILSWNLLTHPIAIFTILFVTGIAFFQKKITPIETIVPIVFSILFMFTKLLLTPKESYDAQQYENLMHYKETISNFFSLYSYHYFLSKLSTTYLSFLLLFLILGLKYKRYIELIFGIVCFVFYMIINIVTFSNGDCDAMMEKSYLPGVFMFVLLYSVFYYQTANRRNYYFITLLLCLLSFKNIAKAHKEYEKRLELISNVLDSIRNHSPKVIANYSDFDEHISRFNNWATSMDALMLSKCKGRQAKTIFFTEDKYQFATDTANTKANFLYLPWNPYGKQDLDAEYFDIPSVPYIIYQTSEN